LTRKVSCVNIIYKDIDGEKYGILYIPESRGMVRALHIIYLKEHSGVAS
jgi:rRNA maturation protein Rpf1